MPSRLPRKLYCFPFLILFGSHLSSSPLSTLYLSHDPCYILDCFVIHYSSFQMDFQCRELCLCILYLRSSHSLPVAFKLFLRNTFYIMTQYTHIHAHTHTNTQATCSDVDTTLVYSTLQIYTMCTHIPYKHVLPVSLRLQYKPDTYM